jgi:hypothetical protein
LSGRLPWHSLEGLIVHELAHVKRRDHWVGWLELVAGCLWWWNPLFWIVRHELREHAELACDAWVVGTLPDGRRDYAAALLTVCECISRTAAPVPALGIRGGGRRALERRLTMILRDRNAFRMSRRGLFAALLLAGMTLPAWSQKPAAESAGGEGGGAASVVEKKDKIRTRAVLSRGLKRQLAAESLPADAAQAIRRFEQRQTAARREMQRTIEHSRQELLRQLQELADAATASGRAADAEAIRSVIQRLRGPRVRETSNVWPDPGRLTEYRDHAGRSLVFEVTGATEGYVWGSDVYTDDSVLAAAAVHAGVLRPGERGVVRVTILPGQDQYAGSSRNGVTSYEYASWGGSYRVERVRADSTDPMIGADRGFRDWNTLYGREIAVGETVSLSLAGATEGPVWGTDVYTDDSSLAAAAVHAGLLQSGQRGLVAVEILPGRDSYTGSARNGVTSLSYGPWGRSFRFPTAGDRTGGSPKPAPAEYIPSIHPPIGGTATPQPGVSPQTPIEYRIEYGGGERVQTPATGDPGVMSPLRGRVGQILAVDLVGDPGAGAVWGTDIYTDDSSVAAAAVHAGVLAAGQRGVVRIEVLPGRDRPSAWQGAAGHSYEGSTRNGVTSLSYGAWGGSYRFVSAEATDPGTMRQTPGAVLRDSAIATVSGDSGQPPAASVWNPATLRQFKQLGAKSFEIELVGATDGYVWGSDVYTDDSSLPAAAVHAGALQPGERGRVRITLLDGRPSYSASSRHGVTSEPWGEWGGSFRMERVASEGGAADN